MSSNQNREWSVVLVDASGKCVEVLAKNEWLSSATAFAAGYGRSINGVAVVMPNDAADALMAEPQVEPECDEHDELQPTELKASNFVRLQGEEDDESGLLRLRSWIYRIHSGDHADEDELDSALERSERAVCRLLGVNWATFCNQEVNPDELAARLTPEQLLKIWQDDVLGACCAAAS